MNLRWFGLTLVALVLCGPAFAGTAIYTSDADSVQFAATPDLNGLGTLTYSGGTLTVAPGGTGTYPAWQVPGLDAVPFGNFVATIEFAPGTVAGSGAAGDFIGLIILEGVDLSGGFIPAITTDPENRVVCYYAFQAGHAQDGALAAKGFATGAYVPMAMAATATCEGLRITHTSGSLNYEYHNGTAWTSFHTDTWTVSGGTDIVSGDLAFVLYAQDSPASWNVEEILITGPTIPYVNATAPPPLAPVAGPVAVGVLAAVCAVGGAMILRRKK